MSGKCGQTRSLLRRCRVVTAEGVGTCAGYGKGRRRWKSGRGLDLRGALVYLILVSSLT